MENRTVPERIERLKLAITGGGLKLRPRVKGNPSAQGPGSGPCARISVLPRGVLGSPALHVVEQQDHAVEAPGLGALHNGQAGDHIQQA